MARKKAESTKVAERLPVVVVQPSQPIPPQQAFTLPPLAPEELKEGSKVLPAGVLRTIRVDKKAIERNTLRADTNRGGVRGCKCGSCVLARKTAEREVPEPTMLVEEGGKTTAYWAVEIRGSAMLKNGTETQTEKRSYGCGPATNEKVSYQIAHLVTLAELVVYTEAPRS